MQHFELKGTSRKAGNKALVKAFRREGLVPCNLYGGGTENILFTVNAKDLRGLTHTPAAYIVDLVLDGKKARTAIVHELQFHPVHDICLHVDFLAVDEKKPIAIDIPLIITGHAKGVQKGGKFSQRLRALRVSALMKDLPDSITVPIDDLDLDKRIVAGDIKLDKVNVLTDKDAVICMVRTTRNVEAAVETAAEEGEEAVEGAEEGEAKAEE
ncbi:MAG TPA: 50S ribosomal protein L25 [Candidatus Cryptobacteroides sp.]|jgi:large subunit ribosomal protein L25|nr:50S ribosomal protein L25 [Candidatus Cryptobacteroides sp.]